MHAESEDNWMMIPNDVIGTGHTHTGYSSSVRVIAVHTYISYVRRVLTLYW
jgi:hypothetical protein